jgi:hypothetical protein
VIFGRKITKHYRGKLQTEIEDMNLPNPVIRSHYGNGFIKQYVRDHLILRTEAASNNVKDYGVNKAVENLPVLHKALSAINDNYLNVQQDILETFVDRGQLQKLAEPTVTSTGKRVPGLKLDHPRQLASKSATRRASTLDRQFCKWLGCLNYPCRTPPRRYQLLPHGYSICLVFLKLCLCTTHGRPSQPYQSRRPAPIPNAKQLDRLYRSRLPRQSRWPKSRVTHAANANKIHVTIKITV